MEISNTNSSKLGSCNGTTTNTFHFWSRKLEDMEYEQMKAIVKEMNKEGKYKIIYDNEDSNPRLLKFTVEIIEGVGSSDPRIPNLRKLINLQRVVTRLKGQSIPNFHFKSKYCIDLYYLVLNEIDEIYSKHKDASLITGLFTFSSIFGVEEEDESVLSETDQSSQSRSDSGSSTSQSMKMSSMMGSNDDLNPMYGDQKYNNLRSNIGIAVNKLILFNSTMPINQNMTSDHEMIQNQIYMMFTELTELSKHQNEGNVELDYFQNQILGFDGDIKKLVNKLYRRTFDPSTGSNQEYNEVMKSTDSEIGGADSIFGSNLPMANPDIDLDRMNLMIHETNANRDADRAKISQKKLTVENNKNMMKTMIQFRYQKLMQEFEFEEKMREMVMKRDQQKKKFMEGINRENQQKLEEGKKKIEKQMRETFNKQKNEIEAKQKRELDRIRKQYDQFFY